MDDFKALMLSRGDGAVSAAWTTLRESDLMDGDVTVRVTHSTINYKDGLALTGTAAGHARCRSFPASTSPAR